MGRGGHFCDGIGSNADAFCQRSREPDYVALCRDCRAPEEG